jgi:hypothetical protein
VSFFDDVDEPAAPPRSRRPPTGSRPPGGRPPGGRRPPPGGRSPRDQQAIQTRRIVAGLALLIVIILIAVGVHSCQVSQRNSSMKDFNNNVSALIDSSDQTSRQLFQELSSGTGATDASGLQQSITQTAAQAARDLSKARGLDVPGEMGAAQRTFLLAMQMRHDGIVNIAQQIQPALSNSTSKDAINSIALSMARFYASDVLYKGYTVPAIAGAFHGAGIAVGPPSGETINGGQFLPSLDWSQPPFIAQKLGAHVPGATTGKVAPGKHGHALNSVAVAGTTLQTGSTNTIPASPPPTFTLSFTNSGANTEHNVVCKVTVSGASVSGQQVVPQTTAGQSTSCDVTLSAAPPKGTQTVEATIQPVPGETNAANNTLSFPVTFQ